MEGGTVMEIRRQPGGGGRQLQAEQVGMRQEANEQERREEKN